MSIAELPQTYRLARTMMSRRIELGALNGVMQYNTCAGSIAQGHPKDWAVLGPYLAGINKLYVAEDGFGLIDGHGEFVSSAYGRVARVEFVCDHSDFTRETRQGAVVFDNRWNALLHASNATLAADRRYNRSLSINMLLAIGVSRELIDQAYQYSRWHLRDEIVFSREELCADTGSDDEFVQIDQPVADTWRWFPVP